MNYLGAKGCRDPSNDDTAHHRARALLRLMFDRAVASSDPVKILPRHLPAPPRGRCVVVGAGKAAASMAVAVESVWSDLPLSGVVVVPYGYGAPCARVQVLEAAHPVPDTASLSAAMAIRDAVRGLESGDLVLALVSGGGSATMCLPAAGLTLEDKQITNRLLLASGLDIRTMNAVRKRISAIKGGKLAEAALPARTVTLAISDIPGDDPAAIASGPTLPDPCANMNLVDVVVRLGPALPKNVARLLLQPGWRSALPETAEFRMVATPALALAAAADVAREHGVAPVILGAAIEGESRDVAREMARGVAQYDRPTVLLSGGETTVTLAGGPGGRGGRNTEFLLALACELEGRGDVWAIAADTDGEDGANLGAAGAIATPDTLIRARASGLEPRAYLDAHDSGSFFEALGDLVVTGPTRTNVNDFRAILVLPRRH